MVVWEPHQPDFSEWNIVQYFTTTQLPKIFCCHGSGSCDIYLNSRTIPFFSPFKRDNYKMSSLPRQSSFPLSLSKREEQDTSAPFAPSPFSLGLIFGDPHFVTLDGQKYSFNGKGEFVVLKAAGEAGIEMEVQGRFMLTLSGNATGMEAVEIKCNSSQVGLYLDEFGQFLFSVQKEFEENPVEIGGMIRLAGGSITLHRSNEKKIRVHCRNGAFISLEAAFGMISADFLVPKSLKGRKGTTGLLGNHDGDPFNDLPLNSSDSSPSQIHEAALTFLVSNQEDSLFSYSSALPFEDFSPALVGSVPFDAELSKAAEQVCKGSRGFFFETCYFDVMQLRNLDVAVLSSRAERDYEAFKERENEAPSLALMGGEDIPEEVFLGEQISFQLEASDPDSQDYTVYVASQSASIGALDPQSLRFSFPPLLSFLFLFLFLFLARLNLGGKK